METKIKVRGRNHIVEPIDLRSEIQYKISTDCNYIMTVRKDEQGNWCANPDVQVMDDDMVNHSLLRDKNVCSGLLNFKRLQA